MHYDWLILSFVFKNINKDLKLCIALIQIGLWLFSKTIIFLKNLLSQNSYDFWNIQNFCKALHFYFLTSQLEKRPQAKPRLWSHVNLTLLIGINFGWKNHEKVENENFSIFIFLSIIIIIIVKIKILWNKNLLPPIVFFLLFCIIKFGHNSCRDKKRSFNFVATPVHLPTYP